MSVQGLGLNNIYAGIDTANVQSISQEIFSRAEQKTVNLSNVDLSQFTRTTQGVDLYNPKTSIDLQREVSIAQSGLSTVNVDVSSLNAQAASVLYGTNTPSAVEGKLFVPTSAEAQVTKAPEALAQQAAMYEISSLSKDSKGSNPFSYQPQGEGENEEKEPLNIFA